MTPQILFDDFVPGSLMGQHEEVFDVSLCQAWRAIFSLPDNAEPHPGELSSLALALAMRAYLSVVAPRPPGNVHARQQFQMHAMPHIGETITTRVVCAHKEIRRERRYVNIQVQASGHGQRALYAGEMSLIWAA